MRISPVEEGDAQDNEKVPEYRGQKSPQKGAFRCGMKQMSYQSVEGEQGCEIDHSSDHGVKAVRGQNVPEELQPLKKQRKIERRNDPQAIYKDSETIGEHNADSDPGKAFSNGGFSKEAGSLTGGCQMDKGKQEHGSRNQHKLHAGTGWGDYDFHTVVHIADILYIYKWNATDETHQAGCWGQEPEQL